MDCRSGKRRREKSGESRGVGSLEDTKQMTGQMGSHIGDTPRIEEMRCEGH
jgi:hypothetical protein